MPNRHITDQQVIRYMTSRFDNHTRAAAAAIAGFSERSARRIDKDPRFPSQKKQPRTWRTRRDPLADVWPRVLEMVKISGIMAVTIFEELQDELGTDAVPDSVRRTMERRIAKWRALHGEDKEVFFPQRHDPGRQALSDFTVADSLNVTIAGEAFPHRLYHFRLAHSGWEHARVILGGESFSAVAEGLQDALWNLGGVPREHRTDSLSAAFKTLNRTPNSTSPSGIMICAGTTACKPPATTPALLMRTAAWRPRTVTSRPASTNVSGGGRAGISTASKPIAPSSPASAIAITRARTNWSLPNALRSSRYPSAAPPTSQP